MDPAGNWCLIESDPGVFTELIEGFGVSGLRFEEVYDLSELEHSFNEVYGLIFLFKYDRKLASSGSIEVSDASSDVFFAQQVIQNACATQAILSILFNISQDKITLGSTLSDLKSFASSLPPEMKGLAISNSDKIRQVHNSFSRADMLLADPERDRDDEKGADPFHFIAFVPCNGALYELDGLQAGPLSHGSISAGSNWLAKAKDSIASRISSYGSEIRFSLMALVQDPLPLYEKQLAQLMDTETPGSSSEKAELQRLIYSEKEKKQKQHFENVLRRHHFIPLVFNTLFELAKNEMLDSAISKARPLKKRSRE